MAIELPEANIISSQMDDVLKGKTVFRARLCDKCASLIQQGFIHIDPDSLTGHRIEGVSSKGKWIFVHFSRGLYLLMALETGGKILYNQNLDYTPEKYHLMLEFEDGTNLTVWIIGWGFAKIVREEALEANRYPGKLGISPLDKNTFTQQAFDSILGSRKDTIKSILLDQWTIAGMGNGYAQEILFRAKIHPKRKSTQITDAEKINLYHTIRATLQNAILARGSDLEVDLYGRPGSYKKIFGERKKVLTCPVCGSRIEKLVLGSSTYFCPSCQK